MKYLLIILAVALSGCIAAVDPITPRSKAMIVVGQYSTPPARVATSIIYPRRTYRRHVPYWGTYRRSQRHRRWPSYVCSNMDPDCGRLGVYTRNTRKLPYITYRKKPIVIIKGKKPKVHGVIKGKPPQSKITPKPQKNKNKRKRKNKRRSRK